MRHQVFVQPRPELRYLSSADSHPRQGQRDIYCVNTSGRLRHGRVGLVFVYFEPALSSPPPSPPSPPLLSLILSSPMADEGLKDRGRSAAWPLLLLPLSSPHFSSSALFSLHFYPPLLSFPVLSSPTLPCSSSLRPFGLIYSSVIIAPTRGLGKHRNKLCPHSPSSAALSLYQAMYHQLSHKLPPASVKKQ